MVNIDINDLKEIKEELDTLEEDDVVFVLDNDETKYAILPIELYDRLEAYRSIMEDEKQNTNVKVITDAFSDLSYDEYETIKKQLMDTFEKAFKPKPEKLN